MTMPHFPNAMTMRPAEKKAVFFLHVRGDEEETKRALEGKGLAMVGEPFAGKGTTTVRVEADRRTLTAWQYAGDWTAGAPTAAGTLLHYSEE